MLALATHEPHFCILREMVFDKNAVNRCRTCGQEGHYADQCTGKPKEKDGEYDLGLFKKKPYQLLHIPVLREYLTFDLTCNTPFPFDPERAIDDWVFLCFFVGNDFLPHLPTLQIREGAIDMLMHLYTKILPTLPGYLTEHGEVRIEFKNFMFFF
jgi:5'-3' exoribonuclease 2